MWAWKSRVWKYQNYFRHTIKTQCTPLKILMLCINHKVITHVASPLKTPQLNSHSQPFPGMRESVIMCSFIKRWWTPLVDFRNIFLTHTVVSPSYYDSHHSFSLYHCSSQHHLHWLSRLPGHKEEILHNSCTPSACHHCQHLHVSLFFILATKL